MSIAEVAKSAGVSQATVSRVINHVPGVSARNIQLVQQAMDSLGYTPPPPERRPGRRHPPRNKIGVLGAIVLDGLYQHTPGVLAAHLRGMEREAADHDCALAFTDVSDATRLPMILEGRQLVGGVLLGSQARPGVLAAIQHLPWVWLSSHSGPSGDSILAGNLDIAEMAARYLVDRGHRHLAFLSVMSSYPAYPTRAEAFRAAASRAGATTEVLLDAPRAGIDSEISPTLAVLREQVAVLVARFATLSPRPTGLFVPNDMMTAMVYPALTIAGLQPGKDVEIISCNNEEAYLVGLHPRPATIDIGAELMGRRSVEQLLRKIRHPGETRQVHIAVSPVLIEPDRR